jgi:N-acetylglucosaminyl-diphospho-decaprenol L-rhamnosyltransferase
MDRLPSPRPTHAAQRRRRRIAISVCIVNWNCRDLLHKCLRSLSPRRQRVRLEIVVVDNASTDGAAEMIAKAFPHVQLIRNATNAGFARANNQAARLARGRYLFFLNNDTVVPRGALRRLLAFALANPEAGLIGPQLRDPHGRTQVSCRQQPTVGALLHRTWLFRWTGIFRGAYRRVRPREADEKTTRPAEVLMGAALLARRKLLLEYGLWDENYTFGGEDVDLCTRVRCRHAVIYHPAVTIIHHGRVSSRQRSGYVHTNWLLGMARFLRLHAASPLTLLVYKTAVTVDAPLQFLYHVIQYSCRRLLGKQSKAARSWRGVCEASHFLWHGLLPFWRA